VATRFGGSLEPQAVVTKDLRKKWTTLTEPNESSNSPGMPSRLELLRAVTDFVKEFEQRTFGLATQLTAVHVFLRNDLPILLGDVLAASWGEGMTEEQSADLYERIDQIRTAIASKLDTYAVEAMSVDETAWIRERIDVLERLMLNSEGEGSGSDKA
jgi:hypothetical protein